MSKRSKNKQYLYALTNLITNETYFGITNNFKQRMTTHFWSSKQENNTKLYNSIRKYGWENFEKEIVATSKCRTEILQLEEYYVDEFDTINNGLNTRPGGEEALYGADAWNAIKVRSYHIPTGEERLFECISEASQELEIPACSISGVANGQRIYTGEYMFRRYDPDNPNEPFDPSIIPPKEEVRRKVSAATREARKVDVIGTHKSGYTVEFECISDAERALGISNGHIVDCCRGNRGYAGEYTWEYKDEEMRALYPKFEAKVGGPTSVGKVYRILEDGTKDVYDSAHAAEKKLNIKGRIDRSIERGYQCGGYQWFPLHPEEYFGREKRGSKGPVYRILEDGIKDEYKTAGEAGRKTGIKHVRRAVDTGMKAGGYRWYAV
ncbi:GIY-YIG catalytic domain-containing endonuclease [Paramecium bursaria Chlorella virus NY2B]|nr:GIY-YIG catalytic domain-containing endonuclease [Paramecium bursaria Chlorella virus NY2B]